MEDTVVLKQHYIYMFRLDLGTKPSTASYTVQENLIKYFEKYDICNWVGKLENGDKTNKLHYQMAIWSEHKKNKGQIVCMRKYWSDRLGPATCAIKSGKKIKSLVSYSTKDDGDVITNLPAIVLARIPKWKNKTADAAAWNEKIDNFIEDNDLKNDCKTAFGYKLMEFYKLHNKRPTRANIQYLMWSHNKIGSAQLLLDWKLIDDNYGEDTISNL